MSRGTTDIFFGPLPLLSSPLLLRLRDELELLVAAKLSVFD